MKVLVVGASGQLGRELTQALRSGMTELGPIPARLADASVATAAHIDADLSDIAQAARVFSVFDESPPDVVINCAAYTDVDGCESNQDVCLRANALLPRNLARLCAKAGSKLVHVSTDYVFDGEAREPYAEWDAPRPISAYGKSKLLGEQYVREASAGRYFIVRLAWLYGRRGRSFVSSMLRVLRENGTARVVDDQYGTPTNCQDAIHHILKLADTHEYGLYHCAGKGVVSRCEFAREIARAAGHGVSAVTPCSTHEYSQMARRPANSALTNAMLMATVGDENRHWKDALREYFSGTINV